jgi:hypothetical protein
MGGNPIEASNIRPLAPAEAPVGLQAILFVRLLQAGEVLPGAIAVPAPLEATMVAAAPGALTEEDTGEAMVGVAVTLEVTRAAEALAAPAEEVRVEVTGGAIAEVTAKLKE